MEPERSGARRSQIYFVFFFPPAKKNKTPPTLHTLPKPHEPTLKAKLCQRVQSCRHTKKRQLITQSNRSNKKIRMKDNFLQDIWQIHTDVQEQMLRLRSAPVSIIPESARIVGEKLYLTADENDKTEKIYNMRR